MISQIKTGDYELVDSGVVQVIETEETVLTFGDSAISFIFEKTSEGEPGIKVNSDESKITFVLMNVNQPSYGTTDFVKFGKADDGKDAYISFRVHSLNDKRVRSLEFAIYKR